MNFGFNDKRIVGRMCRAIIVDSRVWEGEMFLVW